MKLLTAQQMRDVETIAVQVGTTYTALMEIAGTSVYRFIKEKFPCIKSCVLLCGKGNNGGDAFVVARLLSEDIKNITVMLLQGDPVTEDALLNFSRLPKEIVRIINPYQDLQKTTELLEKADLIIDGVYGIGFKGKLNGNIKGLFTKANSCKGNKLAIDIPSGITCDTACTDENSFKSNYTVTFGFAKPAHYSYPAREYCGEVKVTDIGIPRYAINSIEETFFVADENIIINTLPKRKQNSNKGDFGKLLNICGSRNMCGAAILAAKGAMRCGAGLVTVGAVKSLISPLMCAMAEPLFLPLQETEEGTIAYSNKTDLLMALDNASACLIGCGIGQNEETYALVYEMIKSAKCPLIIDADGINAVAKNIDILLQSAEKNTVLTPHPGEMSRLTGLSIADVQNNRIEVARQFAHKYKVTLVLKGAATVAATASGKIIINSNGNSGLAKGGSGDLLAGMIAGFAAQGILPENAAACGVYLHGKAADEWVKTGSEYSLLPSDLLDLLPLLIKQHGR